MTKEKLETLRSLGLKDKEIKVLRDIKYPDKKEVTKK